jgi:hypothetical protein
MALLRAIGGSTDFSSPDLNSAKQASSEQDTNAELASGDWIPIETEIPHCCFLCRWCAAPILLPHDAMGLPFGGPLVRRIEARSVGTVCGKCGHLGVYSFFRGSQGFNTRHKFVPARPAGKTLLLAWLYCEEPTCAFPLPFFVTLADSSSEESIKELAAAWNAEELVCTAGHQIIVPRGLFEAGAHPPAIDLRRAGPRLL